MLDKSPLSYAIQYLRDVRNSLSPPPNEATKPWSNPGQFFENLVEINLAKTVASSDATQLNEEICNDDHTNNSRGSRDRLEIAVDNVGIILDSPDRSSSELQSLLVNDIEISPSIADIVAPAINSL